MIKAAFNAMLNSTKPMSRPPSGVNPSKFGLKWSEISDAIKEFHKPIAHHFYTGVGLRLQRIDSDIAERVLLHFASMGRSILPLHDSFMMHYGDEDLLAPVMQHAFEEVVGLSPKIDRKKFPNEFAIPCLLSMMDLGQKLRVILWNCSPIAADMIAGWTHFMTYAEDTSGISLAGSCVVKTQNFE